MCCQDEQGRDKVLVPIGAGIPLDAADRVEFVRWSDTPLPHEEAARRFKAWLKDKVSGGFYYALCSELKRE